MHGFKKGTGLAGSTMNRYLVWFGSYQKPKIKKKKKQEKPEILPAKLRTGPVHYFFNLLLEKNIYMLGLYKS